MLASSVVISEFMASNDATLQDARGSTPDWIELHNASSEAVNLQGWSLTDDRDRLNRWRFPEVQLEADSYLIVFASGEDRRDTELHTNFKLDADGEDLVLVQADGTIASQYRYPAQSTDVSYGLSADATTVGYLSVATPGQPNSLIRGRDVQFDHASGLFAEPFFVTLSLDGPTVGTIHYTIDGTGPTVDSPVYTDPIRIEATTWVQAISVDPGAAPSGVTSRWHMKVGEGLHDFTSDLPVVVVDNFGQGALNQTTYQYSGMAIFEPDPITGRTSLLTTPQLETRAGLKVRGQDSSGKPKQHYAVEAWDERNRDTEITPFGFPAESDWIMFPPYDTDRALLRNSIMFELTSQMGRYAPRQQFVEVYHNRDGGDLSAEDYVGVYVFLEKIKRGDDRIDVKGLGPQDNAEPEISGGWMLKLDVPDPGDTGFLGGSIQIQHVDPKEEDVTPEQSAWIKNYFDEMRQALTDTNPETGYAQYIDVDSWIDYHLLTVLAKNSDGLNRSTYFYKDRGGKIQFGPTWDNDRSMGYQDDIDQGGPEGWASYRGTQYFDFSWWGFLFEDPNFTQKWIDRWTDLRQDVLSDDNINAIVDSLASDVAESQVRNFERWPDVAPDGGSHAPPEMQNWEGEVLHLRNWLLERVEWIDSQFVSPPQVTPDDGLLSRDEQLMMLADRGTIYYTTDGSDPRLPGGDINPEARRFNRVQPLIDDRSTSTYLVPVGDGSEDGWQNYDYDDFGWQSGAVSIGFDTGAADQTTGFTVRDVRSAGTIDSLAAADALLAGEGVASELIVTDVPAINYTESSYGHFRDDAAFPGGSGDDFVIQATTQLVVNDAGQFTFGVDTDDGVRLRIDGETIIENDTVRRATDSWGGVFLSAGVHDLELMTFDRSGSSRVELFFARGEHTEFSEAFRLVADENRSFAGLIMTDVQAAMHNIRSSIYQRIPFDIDQPEDVLKLRLTARYDDGFVAYVNGVEVARRNVVGDSASGWSTSAQRADLQAIDGEQIEIVDVAKLLRPGQNILAIHTLNTVAENPDLLMSTSLEAEVVDVAVPVGGATTVSARAVDGVDWSGLVTEVVSRDETELIPGDANGDGRFDSNDLILALASGKFETGLPASFAEGDWNGDLVFDADDLLLAASTGRYEAE